MVLTSKPGAVELSAQRDAVPCSAQGQAGKGASGVGWGSPLLRRTRRDASDPRGQTPSRGRLHTARKDEDSGHLPAVLRVGARGSRAVRGEQPAGEAGLACPCESNSTSPAPSTLSHLPTPPLPPPHALGLSVRWLRARGRDVNEFTHWARLRKRYPGQQKRARFPLESQELPGAAPHPRGTAGKGLQGTGAGVGDSVRSTSRHTQPGSPRSTGTGGSSPHV